MITIGLTGNIASGKSMVSKCLKELGAKIIDADIVARNIVQPGSPALGEISRTFGKQVINLDGTLNRKKLGSIVFANANALEKLNKITHPRIREAIDREIEEFKKNPTPSGVLVIDAPLLIEVDIQRMVDRVWVIQIDPELQLQRLMLRDKLNEQEARQRIASQMPQEEKLKYADKVICNNGTSVELRAVVKQLWKDLQLHV